MRTQILKTKVGWNYRLSMFRHLDPSLQQMKQHTHVTLAGATQSAAIIYLAVSMY